jgi:O-antigen ligase
VNLLNLQKNLFYFVVVLTPSLFTIALSENFEFVKTYFLVITLLTLSLISLFYIKKLTINLVDLVLITFLFFYTVSTVFSTNFQTSYFGLFNVYGDGFLFVGSIVTFLILSKSFLQKLDKNVLLKLVIYGSIFPVFYGLAQLIGFDTFNWQEDTNRIFSTFGQANFFGMYVGLILLLCIYYLLELKIGTKIKRALLYCYIAILLIVFFKTLSLSSILAFGVILLLYITLRLRYIRKKSLVLLAVFVLIGLLLTPSVFLRFNNQLKGGFNNGAFVTDDTAKVRLVLYSSTLNQSINTLKIFLIGSGPETFSYNYIRDPKLYETSEWKTLFTKPHNFFLEEFFELGLAGVVFITFMFLTSFFYLRKNILFIVPLYILTSSLFFWPGAYMMFILFLFWYIGYLSKPGLDSLLGKVVYKFRVIGAYRVFWIFLIMLDLVFTSVYVVSFVLHFNKPCVAKNILSIVPEYILACGVGNNDQLLIKKALEVNPKNKIIKEKAGLYFLNTDTQVFEFIFEKLLEGEPTNPIYLYYTGLVYEKKGNKEKAQEYFVKAVGKRTNFYEAEEKLSK